MTQSSWRQFSTTRNSNMDLAGGTVQNNQMYPSGVDNAFREFMGQTAEWLVEMGFPTAGGTANALTLTPTTALSALATGQVYTFKAASTNTGAATLAVSGLAAKALRRYEGGTDVALVASDILLNACYTVVYDATANAAAGGWVIVNSSTLFQGSRRARPNFFWNGAMAVSQQNGTTLGTTNGYFITDSLAMYYVAGAGAVSGQQVAVTSLNGSPYQAQWKCTTINASPGATNFDTLTGKIEGLMCEGLLWGSASANQATLAFNFTGPIGTYNVHIQNRSANRHIAVPFTVAVANTEARYTVVIPGDTSGTWTVDNDTLLTIDFVLVAGSNFVNAAASTWGGTAYYAASTQFNARSSTSNTINITDVQFCPDPDKTGVAPPWVPVDIGQAQRDCDRYWGYVNQGIGRATGTTTADTQVTFPTMRAAPTLTLLNGTSIINELTAGFHNVGAITPALITVSSALVSFTSSSGLTSPNMVIVTSSSGGVISRAARMT